jgi:glutamyl-tRNA reductase
VEERERLSFSAAELQDALASLAGRLRGAVILSTCNRTELYTTVPEETPDADLIALLNGLKGTSIDRAHVYVLRRTEAVRHLFGVAAGIDSMVLGEPQILGQVRDALTAAKQAGTLDRMMSKLLHAALATGKRVRSETDIGRHAVSVGSAAVALASKVLGDLVNKTVLVISAGSIGKLTARSLAGAGGCRILVANRTKERAEELARLLEPGAETYGFGDLGEALAEADIVISGTGADGFLLGPAEVSTAMKTRQERGLLFIDIAVPRDIDPRVAEIANVHLYDIDDIEAVTAFGLYGRQRELRHVGVIIDEETAAFEAWLASLDVVPVISALRHRAEEIRQRELERALRRMPGLDDETRGRIEAMTAAIVKKMLDRPIARLKNGPHNDRYLDALQDLFNLPLGDPGADVERPETGY